jgi:hypothetical protein
VKYSSLLISIALALLLSAANGGSAQSNQARPNQHKEPATEETKGAEQRQPEPTIPLSLPKSPEAALLEALRTIHAQQEAAAKQDRPRYEPLDAPSNLIALGLLIIGAIYSFFAWKQWTAIKEQARIARSILAANRIALNIGRKSADAAMLSAKTTREAQRGYIFGSPLSPIQEFEVGKEPRIWMGLKNVGSTRISDCVSESWVEVLKKPFVDFSNNAHYQRKEDRFALYPNAPGPPYLAIMRWNEPLTEQQFRDIQADKWALCIRVRLQYRDAFGDAVTQNFAFSSNSVTWETLPKYND